mmetsp:Transcript_56253/g.91045  ORF Transcript_56253/g.91045 Transcript_56253/m.91045 type:complete len:292 (-) Transcript_56253:783-1658(-)
MSFLSSAPFLPVSCLTNLAKSASSTFLATALFSTLSFASPAVLMVLSLSFMHSLNLWNKSARVFFEAAGGCPGASGTFIAAWLVFKNSEQSCDFSVASATASSIAFETFAIWAGFMSIGPSAMNGCTAAFNADAAVSAASTLTCSSVMSSSAFSWASFSFFASSTLRSSSFTLASFIFSMFNLACSTQSVHSSCTLACMEPHFASSFCMISASSCCNRASVSSLAMRTFWTTRRTCMAAAFSSCARFISSAFFFWSSIRFLFISSVLRCISAACCFFISCCCICICRCCCK